MEKKKIILSIFIIFAIFSTNLVFSSINKGVLDNNVNSSIHNSAIAINDKTTVLSDTYPLWNEGDSYYSSIAVDASGTIHVVWYDTTNGAWGTDIEIMYASNSGSGWSNATVISDDETLWNDGASYYPSIAVDASGTIHVVWSDYSYGAWGTDIEIMYTSNSGSGWSNATVISDDETLWNDGASYYPSIAIDASGSIHVVWFDYTDGAWGTDGEIMYTSYVGSKLESGSISLGYTFLFFMLIGIIGIVVYIRRKSLKI